MQEQERMAGAINTLAAFLGCRDVPALTQEALRQAYGWEQADVMVLFGGSILCGGDVLADAMRQGVARTYVIVGGAGHTTQTLRDKMHAACPEIETDGRTEAEIFDAYLRSRHGLHADLLETRSTNCGNNITELLALLDRRAVPHGSLILCQDATMQRRMDATLRKHAPGAAIVNYAAYAAQVAPGPGGLRYTREIWGMWDLPRYLTLLMGEIPRLADDENGYGPRGKGFLAHVEIPAEVRAAFETLRAAHAAEVRTADPRYAGETL